MILDNVPVMQFTYMSARLGIPVCLIDCQLKLELRRRRKNDDPIRHLDGVIDAMRDQQTSFL